MGDSGTRHSQRAAAGLSKAIRREYVPPDTRVVGPDGTVRFLGRRTDSLDPVVAYHKYNPARRDSRTGKRPKPGAGAAAAGASQRGGGGSAVPFGRSARNSSSGPLRGLLRGPMDLISRVPLMHVVLTAALAHRVWCFVTRRFFGGGPAAAGGERQLAKRGAADDDEYDDDMYELDERAEELLAQMQNASMLPTMVRASLPRQHRTSLAKRAAQQFHTRPRGYRTAHQMMHGGPAPAPATAIAKGGGLGGGKAADGSGRRQAQRRPLGKLEKMDLIIRQQVRAAMLAQQRQQEQLLLGALEAGPSSGARLALPGPAGAPGGAAGGSGVGASVGHSAGVRQVHPSSGPLVPSAASVAGALPLGLQGGPLPPPAFRALPPELRARMQGARQPGAASLAPAARAAAAGPPPLETREAKATSAFACGASGAAAVPMPVAEGGGSLGMAVVVGGEVAGRGQGQGDAVPSGGIAAGEGGSEEAEARLAVPRVARRAVARGQASESEA